MGKSKYIKTLTQKDKDLLHMTSTCGHFTPSQARELNNSTYARLNQLANSGYLDKHRSVNGQTSYTLGDKGKEMFGKENCYTPASQLHDGILTNYYIQHEQDREYMQPGRSYAEENGINSKGMPDIVVVRETTVIGVEAVTINYKSEEITEKQEVAQENNITLQIVR